jgi:ubiquinone/menaquinone biosynthesis C-methylase UbiE
MIAARLFTRGEKMNNSPTARHFARRTADKQAAFFLSHLRPGMALLDCGCGPGAITFGLAAVVAPGEVVGIDLESERIAQAQSSAAQAAVTNVRFEVSDVYTLPFPDDSFDAVFSHAVFMHLRDPMAALREMYRVLKPGGVIGIRDCDYTGYLVAGGDPILLNYWPLASKWIEHRGGNAYRAKHLRALLQQADFVNVHASASYDSFGTAEGTQHWGSVMAAYMRDENIVREFEEFGLATRLDLEKMASAWQAWGETPGAFHASAFGEVVGWKE